jgi:HSP20 family protein
MSDRLNRVVARSFVRTNADKEMLAVPDWLPAVDIVETPEEYVIKAELAEVKKEDVKVTVDSGTVIIQGERRQEKDDHGKRFHRIERSYGSFMRSFAVPDNVDPTTAKAEFKDGVLQVHLAKAPRSTPKSVDVKIA